MRGAGSLASRRPLYSRAKENAMDERERRLIDRGFSPECNLSAGVAIYKPVVIDGTTAYVAGCVPFDENRNLTSKGRVPTEVSVAEAQRAAALCAANILRLVRREVGSLDRIER